MTRVNCVPVGELTSEALIIEHLGPPKIVTLVRAAQARGLTPFTASIPSGYSMTGEGHAHFFYDKCLYLDRRIRLLKTEMQDRGMECADYDPGFLHGLHISWLNDWHPKKLDLYLNRLYLRELAKGSD